MTEKKEQQGEQEEQDAKYYQKLISRTDELMASGRKTLDEAVKKAREEVTSAGNYSREQSDKIAAYVKRDLQHAVNYTSKTGKNIRHAVDPKRLAAGTHSLVARILTSTADTLGQWAQKSEQQLEFKTGEMTGPGTLSCKNCQEELQLTRASRIPPCPKCHQTLFRKSY